MPPIRPNLSITLPRNFIFHYEDGQAPQTPDTEGSQIISPPSQPPPPPRQTFRVRRRRANLPSQDLSSTGAFAYDAPIPSIETTPSCEQSEPLPELPSEPIEGYLAPAPTFHRFMSPPKTPLSQISTTFETQDKPTDWAHIERAREAESISRPSSSCSGFSDSSTSTRSSLGSFPSLGGSCTSPESDTDPFIFPALKGKEPMLSSPLESFQRPNKRAKTNRTSKWTDAMDTHLWITYMSYLQDPTVTPFKMLPGTAPPLGVCHRVAREAKRSWKGPRAILSSISEDGQHTVKSSSEDGRRRSNLSVTRRTDSPDTIKPSRSGSTTPTDPGMRKPYPKWPRTESATRKRLRQLCKRRPSLSPHYQRLMPSRSPSPFTSSRPQRSSALSSPFDGSSFSTRELNLSLTTTTSSTMQPDGPLSQLTSEDITPKPPADETFTRSMNSTHRSNAHQKSQSLHLSLGLGARHEYNRLASPFSALRPRPDLYSAFNIRPPLQHTYSDTVTVNSRLDSPLELHAPIPLNRSIKRRAQNALEEEVSPGGSNIPRDVVKNLFSASTGSRHRCIRSRGFSLGDMGESAARPLSSIFTPPSPLERINTTDISLASPMESGLMPPPSIERTQRRLGSPFAGNSTNKNGNYSNTFPRSFSPHGIECSREMSFEERLAPFVRDRIGEAARKNDVMG